MCRASICGTCNGKTWFGCGLHKGSILDNVPKSEWCTCEKAEGDTYPPMGKMPSFLRPHETLETIAKELEKPRNEYGGIPKDQPSVNITL